MLREASNSVLYYGRIVFTSLIDLLRGRESINNLSGPVGIVSAIGQAASYGWQDLLELLALITVNLWHPQPAAHPDPRRRAHRLLYA